MSYPSWRVASWYEGNSIAGYRVVKGTGDNLVEAPNGSFPTDHLARTTTKMIARDAAIQLRDRLTSEETNPRVLAQEARDILRSVLGSTAPAPGHANGIIVAALPLTAWLTDRLDRLCIALDVKDEM